jgi:hypothetical protein
LGDEWWRDGHPSGILPAKLPFGLLSIVLNLGVDEFIFLLMSDFMDWQMVLLDL